MFYIASKRKKKERKIQGKYAQKFKQGKNNVVVAD